MPSRSATKAFNRGKSLTADNVLVIHQGDTFDYFIDDAGTAEYSEFYTVAANTYPKMGVCLFRSLNVLS